MMDRPSRRSRPNKKKCRSMLSLISFLPIKAKPARSTSSRTKRICSMAWTSVCLDANELSLDGPLFEAHSHPRAFGAMPRFLGHYIRDLDLLPLEQAVRKMTSLPAQRERLGDRGLLKQGYFADIT